jgi:hypothetical protein
VCFFINIIFLESKTEYGERKNYFLFDAGNILIGGLLEYRLLADINMLARTLFTNCVCVESA